METELHQRVLSQLRQGVTWAALSTIVLPLVGAGLLGLIYVGLHWESADSLRLSWDRFQVAFLFYGANLLVAATAWTLPTVFLWILLVSLFAGLERSLPRAAMGMGVVFLVPFFMSYGWIHYRWEFSSGWFVGAAFYLFFAAPRLWGLHQGSLRHPSRAGADARAPE